MNADEIGQFGEDVKGEGIMYFSTRDSSPFCGQLLVEKLDNGAVKDFSGRNTVNGICARFTKNHVSERNITDGAVLP